jgi:hypothetical protein
LNGRTPARIWLSRDADRVLPNDDPVTATAHFAAAELAPTTLVASMLDADLVLIDGVVFEASYLRAPDDGMHADDVVLEAKRGELEIAWTCADFDGVEATGDGAWRLANGHSVRFIAPTTVH